MSGSRQRGRKKQSGGSKKRGKKTPKAFLQKYKLEIAFGIVIGIAVVAILSIITAVKKPVYTPKPHEPAKDSSQATSRDLKSDKIPIVTAPVQVLKKKSKAKIAVIMDDLGANRKIVDRLLRIEDPITFSILPHLKNSREVALRILKKGRVVMLHLPMEPKSKKHNAGPGVLLTSHSKSDIIGIINGDFESFPGALGVNNHMGSLFTESMQKVSIVLKEVKRRGLFFVDSRTTAGTVAYDLALKLGVPAAKRDIFLDNDRDKEKVSKMILKLARKAIKNGSAIGIGHPRMETIAALKETLPEVKKMGVEIVPITELLIYGK